MTHKDWSYLKSVIRIIGFMGLLGRIEVGVVILILAEIVGILEEQNV